MQWMLIPSELPHAVVISGVSRKTVEILIVEILAIIVIATVASILWLFIVRWDLVERFHLACVELFLGDKNPDHRQMRLYIHYIRRATKTGDPIDEDELAKLEKLGKFARSPKRRRMIYAIAGIFYASCVGLFGGLVIYEFASGIR